MSVKVDSTEANGVAVLSCSGELDGLHMTSDEVNGLEEQLGEDWAKQRIILDLTEVEYMDSATVGWLLMLHKTIEQAKGRLVVCGLSPSMLRVIELMRINEVIRFAEDRSAALSLIKKKGS